MPHFKPVPCLLDNRDLQLATIHKLVSTCAGYIGYPLGKLIVNLFSYIVL